MQFKWKSDGLQCLPKVQKSAIDGWKFKSPSSKQISAHLFNQKSSKDNLTS